MACAQLVLAILCLCSFVSGQQYQQALWPPKCCMADDFTVTFRGVVGDMISEKKSFGLSNMATMAFDFDRQLMAIEAVAKYADGTTFSYKIIADYNKESEWTISDGRCSWSLLDGSMGSECIGENNGEVTYYGSFNYMGYIPTYTWRTTIWEPDQKGFLYISVTENECLPVTSNFGGYNDQVVPKPETVFSGGNFYNYTLGISEDEKKKWFTVPSRCPPAPPPDSKKLDTKERDNTFAMAKLLMRMRASLH